VVWKHEKIKLAKEKLELRENHSGMETPTKRRGQATEGLRENHSGMETSYQPPFRFVNHLVA